MSLLGLASTVIVIGGLTVGLASGPNTFVRSDPGFGPSSPGSPTGGSELSAATLSLHAGDGPAHGPSSAGSTDPPSVRTYSSMAYDAKDGYVLLFGGYCDGLGGHCTVSQQTWTYVGGNWTELTPAKSPSPRWGAGMTYDSADRCIVLFGGFTPQSYLNDTWEFSHGKWTKVRTASAPNPQKFVTMTYDAKDGYVVLFGGLGKIYPGGPVGFLGDTWTYAGGIWTNVSTRPHPSARYGEGLAYDRSAGYILMFGGYTSTPKGPVAVNDTWRFQGGVWKQLFPGSNPSPRYLASMAFDTADGYLVLFGGRTTSGGYLNDTWTFSGGTWGQSLESKGPAPRDGASLAFDAKDGYLVLFGGTSGPYGYFNDTWTFARGTWNQVQ